MCGRSMCYLFCRCTRSVSVVPPCYYAHLAAFRGRVLMNEAMYDTESSASSGTAGPSKACPPLPLAPQLVQSLNSK